MANITLIDDDKQLMHLLSLTLKRAGHTVTMLDQPQEAVACLKGAKPVCTFWPHQMSP